MRIVLKIVSALLFSKTANAIYEKNKGVNEWKIENLGEIQDLKFVEDSDSIYSVSKDGLMAFFNTRTQQFAWKRMLTLGSVDSEPKDEVFGIKYLSRNLIAHSQKRALLLNTAGHSNFEIDFYTAFGYQVESAPVVGMFDFNGHTISCIAHGNRVVIYQDAHQMATELIDSTLAMSKTPTSDGMEVLLMTYDQNANSVNILVRTQGYLKSYVLDLATRQTELASAVKIGTEILPFTKYQTTLHYAVLESDSKYQVLDLSTMKIIEKIEKSSTKAIQASPNDDIILATGAKTVLMDLQNTKKQEVTVDGQKCSVARNQATENWGDVSSLNEVRVAVSCPDTFQIVTGENKVEYESKSLNQEKNGKIMKFFKSGTDQQSFITQFEDASLQFFSKQGSALQLIWTREEALSGIQQVEIFDTPQSPEQLAQTFDYLKTWDQTVSIAQVPQKMIQRYAENAQYLLKVLLSMKELTEQEIMSTAYDVDIYGYKKTVVALTEYGKVFAFSSYNGAVLWASNFFHAAPQKLLLRQTYDRASESSQTQAVTIFKDSMLFMNGNDGKVLSTQALKRPADEFLLFNIEGHESQFILGINKEDLKQQGQRLYAYPAEELPKDLNILEQNIFFTSIDRASGTIIGYQVGKDWVPIQVWKIRIAQAENEKVHQVRSQHQTASDVDHQHHLPTSFVGDNLIYKYLDSNLFSISTFNSDSNTLTVYIINGVSGKIVYKFQESNVTPGEPIDMYLSENFFVLAFKRSSTSYGALPQQEISVTEFFQSREESDTVKMLKDFYINKAERLIQKKFSSFELESPVVIQESYLLTVDVKKIALTQSTRHVTSKMLVVITSNDQIYSIENALYTARRQHKSEAEAIKQRELDEATTLGPIKEKNETEKLLDVKSTLFPPYDGVIPQKNTRFISHDVHLVDLKSIYTMATRLESTTTVLAIGHDIFGARINPEGNFDRLHENFDAKFLFGSIIFLIFAVQAAQIYVKQRETRENFLKK